MLRGHGQYQLSLLNHRFTYPPCAVGCRVDPHLLQGRHRVRGDGRTLECRGACALGPEKEIVVLCQYIEDGLSHRAAAYVGGADEEDILHQSSRDIATQNLVTAGPIRTASSPFSVDYMRATTLCPERPEDTPVPRKGRGVPPLYWSRREYRPVVWKDLMPYYGGMRVRYMVDLPPRR